MTLGQRIAEQRGRAGLSQADLAERLEVSRQAVSKWETDASVPELDKLLKMSRLFGLTLDELVTGSAPAEPAAPEAAPPPFEPAPRPAKKPLGNTITGGVFCLLGFGVLLGLTMLGAGFVGLVFSLPFWLLGAFCLRAARPVALWCWWGLYALVQGYLRLATGINWRLIRYTIGFDPAMNYLRLLTAWCQFAVMLGLTLATAWHFRRRALWGSRPLAGAAALWLAWWGLPRLTALVIPRPDEYYFSSWYNFLMISQDGVQLVLFAAAVALSAALFRGWRAQNQN